MPDGIQLEERWLKLVRDLASEHLPGCEVRVFGSRATGKARKFSDLDLLVLAPADLDRRQITRLSIALQDSDIPYLVDLVDARVIDPEFRDAILPDSVRLAA